VLHVLAAGLLAAAAAGAAASAPALPAQEALPGRVRVIVLHTLGHPAYDRPELRFTFLTPPATQALWKPRFGAHWIVWTDGTLWPRRAYADDPSWRPASLATSTAAERRRLAYEAAPVYAHLHNGNSTSLGIELAHSGRRDDPIPPAQLAAAAWLVHTLLDMSGGRLTAASVFGHKDLDRRPAYMRARCSRPGCPVYIDGDGRAYRRRVDPPELLFADLRRLGLVIPRPAGADDDLVRSERLAPGQRPAVALSPAPPPPRVRAAR
jgi:hypothetical protein